MNKKILLIILLVVVILALAGGGAYYYWKMKAQKIAVQQAVQDIQEATVSVTEHISQGVLPTIETGVANPMESAQSANPYEKTNPFSNIKVNPFE